MLLNARRIPGEAGSTQFILLAIGDITTDGVPAQGRIQEVRGRKSD